MHKDGSKRLKCSSEDEKSVSESENIFKGDVIHIIPAALGQNRLNLFKKKVLRQGGQLLDSWNDDIDSSSRRLKVTHVVADDSLTDERLGQIVGPLIVNDHSSLHFVKTSWISECLKLKKRVRIEPYLIFPLLTKEPDVCNAIETTAVDCEEDQNVRTYKTDEMKPKSRVNPARFACSTPSTSQEVNHNRHITEKLEALVETYKATKDKWRAMGYERAISALKRHHKEITTWEEAKSLPAIGDRLADKIWEIVESGRLRKMEEVCSNDMISAMKLFADVWGIGPATAQALVQQGHRTLDDLKKANLNRQQVIGLRHYDDFLDRMPREEAADIETTVRKACLQLDQGLEVVACGSYRRKKTNCGDVDVLVTHPDGKSHRGLLPRILGSLRQTGFLTDDLVAHEQNGNQHKYMGVCKLAMSDSLVIIHTTITSLVINQVIIWQQYRRLDIIVVPYSEFACSLLYFTGSAHFNRSMRLLANKMGMSLSEHSLNEGVVRKGQERLCEGIPLQTPTEQSVFEHLGLVYRPPEERDY